MTVMHLSVSFQHPTDTTRSVRDLARREAIARLQNTSSIFAILTGEQVAAFAGSDDPVTAGFRSPDDPNHEPIEDR